MQGVTGDSEQPDYPVRPVTPGEEELMRIHEDGGYCPPDIIEIPGGFQIGRYRIRPERPEIGSAAWFAEAAVRNGAVLSRPYTLDLDSKVDSGGFCARG